MTTGSRAIIWGVCLALILMLILPMGALAQPTDAPDANEIIHVVRRGETLASIAARYRVTIAQIAAYNGLRNPNFVYVGQRLRIPLSPVRSSSPPADERIHIVRPGEYLELIAQRYGVTVQALIRANRLINANRLYVGQRLRIPSPATIQVRPVPSPVRPTSPPPPTPTPTATFTPTPTPMPTPTPTATPMPTPTPSPTLVSMPEVGAASREPSSAPRPTPVPTVGGFLASVRTLDTSPGSVSESVEKDLATVTPTPAPTPTPRRGPIVHVVQRGEFLASIARKYGVSVQALLAANRLRDPNLLYVGQRLTIPLGGAAPSSNPASGPPQRVQRRVVQAPTAGKWIEVNVTTQTLNAYEGDKLVLSTKVSTGLPRTPTVLGRFRIYTKLRSQTMSGPGYYLPNVPYVMYFYKGYALHGTYWHNNFGRPMSHGCVNLRTSDAEWLYRWAPLGTLVVVHR